MGHGPTTSFFSRLRASRRLRLLFALTGLLWMVGAQACVLHDLVPDCKYTADISASHDVHTDDHSDESDHVPCCPHPLGSQLPVQETAAQGIAVVLSSFNAAAPFSQSFSSHTQTPPTPPPIPA